jgi:dimethylamine/trimethylamine dehydrogenase
MENKFSVLFEPVVIGPVVSPNRFYQVPHCNGFGHKMPRALATMRGIKAEGGWGVVCTEEVEIHHSTDLAPNIEGRLWNDGDIPALALMVEAVHKHGSLAGIEIVYNGAHAINLYSRTPALSPSSIGIMGGNGYNPGQTRTMDKEDIRNFRRWHRQAAIRAKRAGFDIIYCYASHGLSMAMHFLLPRYNKRTDEYGGSLKNRTRLLRELIEDTKDVVGDTCAVALRLAVDELLGDNGLTCQGEGYEIVAMIADLPDLWDVNISGWSNDSAPSRFKKEGFQESYVKFVKSLTSKPVVGVGRYTSPESMVSVIKRGIMDLIGAARPSIADPYLPQKIKEGNVEDIRECIGCNICVIGDLLSVPIRCTQNPTMGEEWRRGWHPEIITPSKNKKDILVVGGGPAGLECARTLGLRGQRVVLVEANRELGGRVTLEAELPGLREWRRVVDWRFTQISKLPNISLYPESPMSTDDIVESEMRNVIIATGAKWRRDGLGRTVRKPIAGHGLANVYNPDDILARNYPSGQVLIYDDDHYYIGGVIAELLAKRGCQVTLVTAAPLVSFWTQYTLEQNQIQSRLVELGVQLLTQKYLSKISIDHCSVSCAISGRRIGLTCNSVVLVTDRIPNDDLYYQLQPKLEKGTLDSLRIIGDAEAPNIIAQAVFSGHLAAREFGELQEDKTPFKVEYATV